MKIVITGSRGFIGTHIRNSLQDHDIVEWDIKLKETFNGVLFQDIKDFTVQPDTDFVIHLAGLTDVRESIEIPDVYWTQNVEYSKRVFEACRDIPMLYASSSCVKEWWLSPYGTTKKVLEELALDGHIGLRFTNVYGEGGRRCRRNLRTATTKRKLLARARRDRRPGMNASEPGMRTRRSTATCRPTC